MRNRTEHGFSRLTAISDAGSTPAASTSLRPLRGLRLGVPMQSTASALCEGYGSACQYNPRPLRGLRLGVPMQSTRRLDIPPVMAKAVAPELQHRRTSRPSNTT